MEFYAHSLEGRPPEEWQRLEDHLRNVAEMAAEFAGAFGSAEWGRLAGQLHDIGKASRLFQAYLRHANALDDLDYDARGPGRVDHSTAGALVARERLNPVAGLTLAYVAAGHHAGLPDWSAADTGGAALEIRLARGEEVLAGIRGRTGALLADLPALPKPPCFLKATDYHLWVRMLFSCLVDADYLDTERFMDPGRSEARGSHPSVIRLRDALDRFMDAKTAASQDTPVNAVRRRVLQSCREEAGGGPGLFTLTVPTGGGKTLSSMAFALEHAVRHDKARIIYVIPYTTIVEQTASVFADAFGEGNVVEHHSNLDPERQTLRAQLASENWDAPLIVTTNVQFFESLFAARTSRCRKLHNIVNSVVILDEAQLLPPELLKPCVEVVNALTRHFGVTMLLTTATQPALPGLDCPCEITPEPGDLYRRLRRTQVHLPSEASEPATWEEVASRLKKYAQVLCVVNTRRDCHDLFRLMPEETVHLSALMCGHHRSRLVRYIKWRLRKGKPLRVVSTQLVEAGVDVDFPVVFRALAGLDSIAQAAGRCNREGTLNASGQLGHVHVFVSPKPAPRGLLRKGQDTARGMLALPGVDVQAPETFTRYFESFYATVNDMGERFRPWLVGDVPHVQFRTAGSAFRLIDDQQQRPVVVRYRGSEKWLARLRFAGINRDIMRRLQRYTVNLPRPMVEVMLAEGRLVEVCPQTAPGVIAQGLLRYDSKVGLDVYHEQLPIEDLMV